MTIVLPWLELAHARDRMTSGTAPAGNRAAGVRSRQVRAQEKSEGIRQAAARMISDHGLTGLTHRLVAQAAGVSLAATTYHYAGKAQIIRAATAATFDSYDDSFDRALARFRAGTATRASFHAYFSALMRNTAGRSRERAICWGEIMLYAAPDPVLLAGRQAWLTKTLVTWEQMIAACGYDHPRQRAIVAVDVLIGLLLLVVGLGLSDRDTEKVVSGAVGIEAIRPSTPPRRAPPLATRDGAKAAATRARVLEATIDILTRDGAGAVTRAAVGARAGLTKAAPFYHYPSIADLLADAQQTLFQRAKERYRQGLADAAGSDTDYERLVDRTAAVFLREATEFASESVASYSIWLRADRQPSVREMVWDATCDQVRSWRNVLGRWGTAPVPVNPLLAQALFMGKLVRIVASGSRRDDLSQARQEFDFGLRHVTAETWSTA